MKVIAVLILLWSLSASVLAVNCDLVYDEFDSLMNKEFLLHPEKYVSVKTDRLSRRDYNKLQKNKFLLSNPNRGLGIAIIHTNRNTWGKILFTWGKPFQSGQPSLVIKKAVLYGRVKDGDRPRVMKNINIKSSFTLDIDTGRTGGKRADIWFHNVDGKEMYMQAVNGASLKFPTRSLCQPKLVAITAIKPTTKKLELAKMQGGKTGSIQGEITGPSGEKHIIRREILANGHVLISYSDGSKVERFQGGFIRIAPDGSRSKALFSTAAPAAFPVAPPDPDEHAWLESHRQNLLGIMQSLVDDPALVQTFVNKVDVSDNVYESIDTRSKTIQQLVLP